MANTIKLGNGNWATKEGSLLAYNDENNNFKPLPFTTTRASSATVVNKQGLIETVGSGIPRIDFSDDANGALLLEPTATNLITQSEDFSNAYWTKNSSSVTSGFTSPKGDLSAFKMTANSSNSDIYRITSGTSGVQYTNTLYVKRLSGSGVVKLKDTNNIMTAITLNTEWQRFERTETSNSTNILSGLRMESIGDEILIWGAQLEDNSYATSYIKTVGTAQTRVADTANGSGNSTVINSTEGVLYAEISKLDVLSNESSIILTKDSSNEIRLNLANNNRLNIFVNVGGVNQIYMDNNTFNLEDYNKIAVKYKLNDYSVFVNGTKIHTDTSATVPPNMDELKFNNPIVKTKSVQVYTTALSDAELTTLTTI